MSNSSAALASTSATEARILAAAEECFERFGIAKTTMDDVARLAELSRATVYRYFSDRESLIVSAVRRRGRMNIERSRREIRRVESFAARVEEGIVRDVRRGRRDPLMHTILSSSEVALASRLLSATGVGTELTRELWQPVLAEAQQAGDLREGLDITELCTWISQLEIMFISQTGEDAEVLDRTRRSVRQFVVPGIVAR